MDRNHTQSAKAFWAATAVHHHPVPAHKLASKQAYLSIWFSTLLSFGPHLWFCLSQWCHVLRDCGTILQGASKHITTTLWRVIRHQHDLDSHFARTSECQASLYIINCYSMCSCKLACSIIYIYKFTQITNTRKTPVIAVLEQIAAPGGHRAPSTSICFPCGFIVFICVLALFPRMVKGRCGCPTTVTSMASMTSNIFSMWPCLHLAFPIGLLVWFPLRFASLYHHAWELQQNSLLIDL